ncbi:threonine aspartase 1 [Anoplophora glabripennis]|uniref:threonine aspartase 1 n=1 Tax=Anoplophora glabripennis TaxID=217634 RepID=UPI00087498C4|nr:threonine aspartase 1 [Anoplophora glabripennis]
MTGLIAVHCGAGHHSGKYHREYKKVCNRACRKGMEVLRKGGSALDAVKEAVIVLENDPLTNAGYGSNLTTEGFVENDASIMNGKTLSFGGCGAIKKVKNPITLAYDLCVKQSDPLPLGLIPPTLLVGPGGLQHARNVGLKIVSNNKLISEKATKQFVKYKGMLELQEENQLLDTVGAVCIDDTGHVAAACSSGGLLLKRPGRVGQAALYGSGSWADSFDKVSESSVAVCTTGCGEHLVQTQLAKEIAEDLKHCTCPTSDLHKTMTDKFLKSRYLKNVKQKMGGALVLHVSLNGEVSILWGHSTETMAVGYMRYTDQKPQSIISELPNGAQVGQTVNISGSHFFINKNSQ